MEYSLYRSNETNDITALYESSFCASEGEKEGKEVAHLAYDLITSTPESDIYCFVAKEQGSIIGVIIFSRVVFEQLHESFILSPVAVSPNSQGKGVGQALISFGIEHLRSQGVELLFTYGDPAYYSKVGYQVVSEDAIKAPQPLSYPHGWLVQSLVSDNIYNIEGNCYCVPALNKPQYW